MDDRKPVSKSVLAVSIALVFVLLLVISAFVFGNPASERIEISLPDTQSGIQDAENTNDLQENDLLQITPDNAVSALKSLDKPRYYHQIYSVSVGRNTAVSEHTVELWVNDTAIRAQITDDRQTKSVLSDGNSAWIWYSSNEIPRKVRLSSGIIMEDILGLPTFDYLYSLESAKITDSEYLVLEGEQSQTPCIFISAQEYEGALIRYWIDLETGLLRSADCMEDNTQVYRVSQLLFDRLASGDEAFNQRFTLPDGTSIITE